MKIQLVRDVKQPIRGTNKAAGIDFFVPNDFKKTRLFKGDQILIPSGVKAQVPTGYALIAHNKSGISTKLGLVVGADTVDEDYEGEIHLHLIKVTNMPDYVDIEPGMKIVQFILQPMYYSNVEVVNELPKRESERGSGGFGSTGIY
jgi:dUTP pyrophosphatase